MIGMDANTGKPLEGDAHLEQSIGDLLSTPIGTRCGRRDYGSALFELIDAPLTALVRLRAFAATAVALARWEPRIRLTRVGLVAPAGGATGTATLSIEGERTDSANPTSLVKLTVPLRLATA
ncbi:oxidoreductase [Sphingomonas sp. UV9]|uniref:GPW/gp25 family protein n=1 Tax=Sphingomonas sp. UV9 TaxID=1851410 RepID=UPI000FFC8028|nr:GPW/gp25 family protein [Sphingomonas sp. UV9]RXD05559.1 oxidoreductase [Sphingomonas sp. UV9]